MKVLIIGAGAAGIALASAIKQVVPQLELHIVEKSEDIGGIWRSSAYENLHIHSKSFNYRFIDYKIPASKTEQASSLEVLDYFRQYVTDNKLYDCIEFNKEVTEIGVDSLKKEKKFDVTLNDLKTGEILTSKYDHVILAVGFSNAGNPNLPVFDGEESFSGKMLHSSLFDKNILQKIIDEQQSVTVLGGGKSSQDIICCLKNRGHNKINWIYTKSIWSYSYDWVYKNNIYNKPVKIYLSILIKLFNKGFNRLVRFLQQPLVKYRVVLNPLEQDSCILNSRGALLKESDFDVLKKVKTIKGKVSHLNDNQVVLDSGESITTNTFICATGFQRASNLPKIVIKQDSKAYDITNNYVFFRNMVSLEIPGLYLFTSNIIYPQQLFGYSIASYWLAAYISGKLNKNYSEDEKYSELDKITKTYGLWEGKNYLSNGMEYLHNINYPLVTKYILKDLGVKKRYINALFLNGANQNFFNEICCIINEALNNLKIPQ